MKRRLAGHLKYNDVVLTAILIWSILMGLLQFGPPWAW